MFSRSTAIGVEYKSGTLEALYHEEGRATKNGLAWQFEYTLSDHLGNARVSFTDANNDGVIDTSTNSTEILQTQSYYPFGLAHSGIASPVTAPENMYQYNGKELQPEIGWIDYGSRMYDPTIGRWGAVDLQVEKYLPISPYAYVGNNPIMFKDPNGEEIWIFGEDGNKYQYRAGRLYTEDGEEYDGKDSFTADIARMLNLISESELGLEVVNQLADSDKKFNFLNEVPEGNEGGGQFLSGDDGHSIFAGALSEKLHKAAYIDKALKIDLLSNELMHAYQVDEGEIQEGTVLDLNMEFASDLFSRAILNNLGYDAYLEGTQNTFGDTSTEKGKELKTVMNKLLSSGSFDAKLYKRAMKLYTSQGRGEGYKNRSGFPTRAGKKKVAISKLFPLNR